MKSFDKDTSLVLKAIAVLMMLFHHMFRSGLQIYQGVSVSYFPFPEINVHNVATVCKICVSLYTFISGYGLYINYKKESQDVGRWVLHREKKLLMPFWVIVIFCWIVCQIVDGRVQEIYFKDGDYYSGIVYMLIDFMGGATLFGTPTLVPEWWYMSAAVVFAALIPFVVYLEDKLVPALIFVIALPRILGVGYQGGCGVYSFLFIFLLGIICAKYDLVNKWIWYKSPVCTEKIKLLLELLAVLIGYKFYRKISVDMFWEFHYGLYPLLVIFFTVEFIAYIPWIRKSLIFMGKHSTNIYLTHSLFLYVYLSDFIYNMPHFVISYIVLIGISLSGSILIEWMKQIIRYFTNFLIRQRRNR